MVRDGRDDLGVGVDPADNLTLCDIREKVHSGSAFVHIASSFLSSTLARSYLNQIPDINLAILRTRYHMGVGIRETRPNLVLVVDMALVRIQQTSVGTIHEPHSVVQ